MKNRFSSPDFQINLKLKKIKIYIQIYILRSQVINKIL